MSHRTDVISTTHKDIQRQSKCAEETWSLRTRAKVFWLQLSVLRRIQVVALVIWCVALLGSPYWYVHRLNERKQLEELYYSAAGGHVNSVTQLEAKHSAAAMRWLESLAQAPQAFSDSRVEAISAIGRADRLDSEALAPLLWIEQPFVVRHATTQVFRARGCDTVCRSAALFALHAISQGQLTAEMRLAQNPSLEPDAAKRYASDLLAQGEADYLMLLRSDPCAARSQLHSEYRSEKGFIENVSASLPECSSNP